VYYKLRFILNVAKTMDKQKTCKGCSYEHNCQNVYKRMADFQGSSIIFKVCLAFLLPVLVFIISLAVFERTLTKMINTVWLQITLGFLFALSVTFVVMLIIKAINKEVNKKG